MNKQDRIKIYDEWFSKINREGIEDLKDFLYESSFFEDPASSRFHSNYEGGLADHSLNVLKIFIKLYNSLRQDYEMKEINKESIVIVCLLHDLCKIGVYKEEQLWYKNADTYNKWISYKGYKTEDNFPLGHGEKSLYLISKFIKLTDEEALAIRWHMGPSEKGGEEYMWNAFNKYILVRLLHTADMASLCVEKTIDWKTYE